MGIREESMTEYLLLVDSLIEHEKSCDICLNFAKTDDVNVNELNCVYGWLIRDKVRIVGEKIENPEKFVV